MQQKVDMASNVKIGGKTSTSGKMGRKPGVPNKATTDAREAIAMFVNKNANQLQVWLDKVATGVPSLDKDGNVRTNKETGAVIWMTEPNPEKAFDMFQKVIEFHVPKLQRTVLVGEAENPVGLAHSNKPLNKEELQAELAKRGLPTTLLDKSE